MLTFYGIWQFGEMFSSGVKPGFHCTGQMASSKNGIVWVSRLLIEWPMVVEGLWYGQVYVMNNEHIVHFINGILKIKIKKPTVVPFNHNHHLMLKNDNARPHV
ncbi:hypothetical protein GOODEAATRI_028576, partial [Goodea atripinnis]